MLLHLGVVDLPYNTPDGSIAPEIAGALSHGNPPKRGQVKIAATIGDVATFLENKYHVMEIFFEAHQADIAEALESSLAGALENLLMGGPATAPAWGAATSAIEALFRKFLDSKEMDELGIPGVPTAASLKGVSHRFKQKAGPIRPSFVDTGMYEASFTVWVDA